MKRNTSYIFLFLGTAVIVALGSCSPDRYSPDKFLSKVEQDSLIRETVYYTAKLPPTATQETKFDVKFSEYYDLAAQETRVMNYFAAEDGTQYFLLSRKARSITPMQEGIGGTLTRDAGGKLSSYVELFRTWKMPDDTLAKRGAFLFDRMVTGKDLTMYYSKFQNDRYIEFPDGRFFFNEKMRRWLDREKDSLQVDQN